MITIFVLFVKKLHLCILTVLIVHVSDIEEGSLVVNLSKVQDTAHIGSGLCSIVFFFQQVFVPAIFLCVIFHMPSIDPTFLGSMHFPRLAYYTRSFKKFYLLCHNFCSVKGRYLKICTNIATYVNYTNLFCNLHEFWVYRWLFIH